MLSGVISQLHDGTIRAEAGLRKGGLRVILQIPLARDGSVSAGRSSTSGAAIFRGSPLNDPAAHDMRD